MQSASLGQYGNLDFVFLDLKQHSNSLDKEILKEFNSLERLIKKSLVSRKKLETELEFISPKLFVLRLKALEWMQKEEISVNHVLDEVYPVIEELNENPRLKKVGYHISSSLIQNRKLVSFFTDAGAFDDKNIDATIDLELDYSTYMQALALMPKQIRNLFTGLTTTSLFIEFISIAAVMINNGEVKCSDFKIAQLNALASDTSLKYMGYVNHLLTMGKAELFLEEKNDWNNFSMKGYANAYSNDEPNYDNVVLKEPNPEYNK